MNHAGVRRRLRMLPRTSAVGLLLAVMLVIPSRQAGAQFATIEVGPSLIQDILTQINTYMNTAQTYTEYAENVMRWRDTLMHYQQQLVRMQGMIASFGLPAGQPLREVAPNYMVAERCGSGLSAAGLLQAISPNREGDYVQQQRRICQQVQQLQNIKYNETVQFLSETVPQMQSDLKRIEAMRATDNTNGTVDGTTNASAMFSTNLEVQFQQWDARMRAYDGFISTLQETQRQLARMALKGESNPLGTVVKAAALQGALKAGD